MKFILGKNHNHFLFVDDGYVNKFGGEMNFRNDLEKELNGKYKQKDSIQQKFFA